ncbi:MAG: NAD-dependent epimerase/dehydratase family protein [Haliscomenobacter sp.]
MHTSKKILVTGATGLLGSNLVRYLLQSGYTDIRVLHQPSSPARLLQDCANRVEWVAGDVLDMAALDNALAGVQWVFHCAGVVSFDSRKADLMREVNVEGTANVVNASIERGVESLLHVSSIAAIGRTRPGQSISERSKWERSPLNTRYGISKFLGELEVWRGIEEGLSAVVVNPAVIIGGGDWTRGPARFFQMMDRGFSFYPMGATDLVGVRDVVRAMVLLMEQGIRNERFIVSAGKMSYREFFSKVAEALGRPAPKRAILPWIQQVLGGFAWLKSRWSGEESLITRETIRQSALEYVYDNQKLIQALAFEYTPLEETIQETAREFLKAKSEGKD